ncbi:TerB family tellurite resistance protein [Paenibacillus xylaniclasticus]|uniref:TerB family tellurite resistance protein n=1 Tax=Paenibacillus xylaniclasticus TaxID=588083 RepID=UPI000FDBF0EA|nr:TerB family tellurite resistance protein [Paenibacillus xylaniclasticus]
MFLHLLQQKEHKEAFLELANIAVNADGFVNLKERDGLRMIAAELDLPLAKTSHSLAEILGCVQDEHVQQIFLAEILLLSYADGDYNDAEKELIMEMKRQFGISDEKYEAFRDWVVRMDKLKIEGMRLILNIPETETLSKRSNE